MNSSDAISLYVHIPFCEVKCGYCDFYSVPRGHEDFDLQEEYVGALCREITERCRGEYKIRPYGGGRVHSIFFGGGTPSLLRPDLLERILATLADYFTWDDTTEITMECNPKTIDYEGLCERRKIGINRLSLGVQSFQDKFLKILGRYHSGDEARQTILAAQQAGFTNVNFDLIFSLPGQSLEEWKQDLEIALELGTPHLSCYALTIEENTPFQKLYGTVGAVREPPLPDDEVSLAQFWYTRERLHTAGLEAYEISNFSRPGFECRHNQHYWAYGEYIGFGAGAASFEAHPRQRVMNPRNLQGYVGAGLKPALTPARTIDTIDTRTAQGEFVMLALRTREGLSEQWFKKMFGVEFGEVFGDVLSPLRAQQAAPLRFENGQWRLTNRGLEIADTVISQFIA